MNICWIKKSNHIWLFIQRVGEMNQRKNLLNQRNKKLVHWSNKSFHWFILPIDREVKKQYRKQKLRSNNKQPIIPL